MSFPQYDPFPGQQPAEGVPGVPGAAPGSGQQQQPPSVEPGNSPGPYQSGNGGPPGSAGGDQPGGDSKTTLW